MIFAYNINRESDYIDLLMHEEFRCIYFNDSHAAFIVLKFSSN